MFCRGLQRASTTLGDQTRLCRFFFYSEQTNETELAVATCPLNDVSLNHIPHVESIRLHPTKSLPFPLLVHRSSSLIVSNFGSCKLVQHILSKQQLISSSSSVHHVHCMVRNQIICLHVYISQSNCSTTVCNKQPLNSPLKVEKGQLPFITNDLPARSNSSASPHSPPPLFAATLLLLCKCYY